MSEATDFFKNLASAAKAEEKQAQEERLSNAEYTPIFWSAFEKAGTKVLRFRDPILIEKPSDLKITKDGGFLHDHYSGRIAQLAQLYNDAGKRNNFFVPTKADDPTHIFWRLRDVVLKREWIKDPDSKEGKKKALYVHEHNHPELVDRFLTNGKNHGISKNIYDKGWYAQPTLFANVYDPTMTKAHSERKSWAILSKHVNIVKADVEGQSDKAYYDWGVPARNVASQLRDLVSHYGPLNSYDVLMVRPATKDDSWKIRNATRYIEEVPDSLKKLVNDNESFTDEQKTWDLNDIETLTKISDDAKWFKAFKVLFQQVDLAFKTNFHDEMEVKAKIAEEIKAKAKIDKSQNTVSVSTEEKKVEESVSNNETSAPTPTRSRTRSHQIEEVKQANEVTWQKLHDLGYKVTEEKFTPEIQAMISHIDDNGIVKWKDSSDLIPDDAECGFSEITGVNDGVGFESPATGIDFCLFCGRNF